MTQEEIAALRNEYAKASLDEANVGTDPFIQFDHWFKEAVASKVLEPNAMVVCTVGVDQKPSQRTVLLKGFDESQGFVFYTNYTSRKGAELDRNPQISLLFPWYELERQVIVTGRAIKVSRKTSEAYFHTRPRGSQQGAWASSQSSKVDDRTVLEKQLAEVEKRFEGKQIPLPDFWGGYGVVPNTVEFWQGRPNRLHDRILFEKTAVGWQVSRLSP